MTTEIIQDQLANQIANHNKTWGNLLAKLNWETLLLVIGM